MKKPAKSADPKKASPRKTGAAKKAAAPASHAVQEQLLAPAGEYIYAVGRRKRAVATTKLMMASSGGIMVNGKAYDKYFPVYEQREAVLAPLRAVGKDDATIVVRVSGGGLAGQSEAVRHGISRALIELNPDFRKSLKKLGFLTRDPREKERKKYGFKKARKRSQWAKR